MFSSLVCHSWTVLCTDIRTVLIKGSVVPLHFSKGDYSQSNGPDRSLPDPLRELCQGFMGHGHRIAGQSKRRYDGFQDAN